MGGGSQTTLVESAPLGLPMPSKVAPSRLRRSSVVVLVVDKVAEAKLKLLCSLSSKLWNEVSYARRRMFFETGRVDLKSTYKEFYEKYKVLIGSATAQQVLNKNDEAWRSFLRLLKLKKGEEATTIHVKG